MIKGKLFKGLLIAICAAAVPAAHACNEVIVTLGKGLATQAYIAPNPANVLILYSDTTLDREYTGLDLAGHKLTLVADFDELSEELAANDYDIVISPLDLVDSVNERVALADTPLRVVPVISRELRRDRSIKDRFSQYYVDGSGVAKFLTVINRVMAG